MRISRYYLPVLKDITSEKTTISHKLMLKSGMIRNLSKGIYSFLPLAQRVFNKIHNAIQSECDKNGLLQITMPTIQPSDIWIKSERYDIYGKEMLRIKDRNDNDFLYGPTHEEVITDLISKDLISYKKLPINLYQIQWKFRDEIRPRFGLMRAREFMMFDAYSFDISQDSSKKTYELYYDLFLKIFQRLNIKTIPVNVPSGEIGGNLSHEFQIPAPNGESTMFIEQEAFDKLSEGSLKFNELSDFYIRNEDSHNENECKDKTIKETKGIEIGHIFNFGTKYSSKMDVKFLDNNGKEKNYEMGSYGIGVSRIIPAFIETSHDENGIIWNKELSPFDLHLINIDIKDSECTKNCDELHDLDSDNILYDDSGYLCQLRKNVKFF